VARSGTRRPQEIEENVRALPVLAQLTPEVLARIDSIMQGAAGQTDTLPVLAGCRLGVGRAV
jgi:hypothetical protein